MVRYRLEIEYEGTRYSGWQVQRNARTVQGEMMRAIEEAFETRTFEFQGAGRTDAGVHALAQTAHLEVAGGKGPLVPDQVRMRLNDRLPADIHVIRARPVPSSFHARHDAISRSYLYQVSRRRTAFGKKLVWWVRDRLDVGRMQDAATVFVGMHDFASFCALPGAGGGRSARGLEREPETRVKVEEVRIEPAGDLLLMRIRASHFLWKMVRQMVGVLVEAGRGRLGRGEVARFLSAPSPRPAELTCPPSGLFLERVFYAGDRPEEALRDLRGMLRVEGA